MYPFVYQLILLISSWQYVDKKGKGNRKLTSKQVKIPAAYDFCLQFSKGGLAWNDLHDNDLHGSCSILV